MIEVEMLGKENKKRKKKKKVLTDLMHSLSRLFSIFFFFFNYHGEKRSVNRACCVFLDYLPIKSSRSPSPLEVEGEEKPQETRPSPSLQNPVGYPSQSPTRRPTKKGFYNKAISAPRATMNPAPLIVVIVP